MKRILLVTIAILVLMPCQGRDEYRYRNITMNDGLAANTVRNIVQDPYGFIWLGTDNGLCRYDGTQVQTYRIAELGMNQYISSLLTAEDAIYVGTEKGVFQLKQASQQFTRLPMDISSAVTSLSLDKSGDLWVSTMENGVWHYGIKTGQARQYKLSADNAAAQILIDNTNQIWTITNWGGPAIERLNRLHDQFEPVGISYDGNSGGLRMLQTRDGRIWIGSWEDGLLLMHGDGRLEQVLNPALARVGQHIHTLYERADDCISIGCDDGVICFNPKTREWKRFFEDLKGVTDPEVKRHIVGRDFIDVFREEAAGAIEAINADKDAAITTIKRKISNQNAIVVLGAITLIIVVIILTSED